MKSAGAPQIPSGQEPIVVLVFAPRGLPPAGVLRAAERAGALGIFEPIWDDADPALQFERLRAAGVRRFGVALAGAGDLAALRALAVAPECVIAPPEAIAAAPEEVTALRAAGVRVMCEAVRWNDAVAAVAADTDGFILKGHECAGLVSEQTAFILLQEFRRRTDLPLIVRGGITPETAAAAWIGGAAGVALDDQILLMAEAGLTDDAFRRRIEGFSGSETFQIEHPEGGVYLRGLERPGSRAAQALERALQAEPAGMADAAAALSWRAGGDLAPGGQGLVLAASLARRHATIGRLVGAIRKAVTALPEAAAARRVLAEGGPLARILGTRYPILQGPMTRVSDVSDFSARVAGAGALPFTALALLRAPQVEAILTQTRDQAAGTPWGVGILGFAATELLQAQFEVIDRIRPDFALVAGGRVNQVDWFEERGIPAFVHASSPGLVKHYLDQGMRRFVVEGRECGGHIGPLSSFALWGAVVDALRDHPVVVRDGAKVQVVFAGGIHDDVSAAMAATIAEPLAERGVGIGVLMGTAYLFTREIVESGAIVPDYQQVALSCTETLSLWEGPGFASRCAVTPIAGEFRSRRRELEASGATVAEVREALETYSLGRLRMATKGVARLGPEKALVQVDEAQRRREGMYMIGQAAALRDRIGTIAELHETVADGSVAYLARFAGADTRPAAAREPAPPPADIAIVGMGTILPGSDTLAAYWRRILSGESAVRAVPEDRWDKAAYYDEDRTTRDRVYSFRGGFLEDVPFDPLAYGIPPASLTSVDPMQLLSLELASDVMRDASRGAEVGPDGSRISVMLGFSGGVGETGGQYVARAELRRLLGDVPEELLERLPEWSEDSFAGLLPNVSAGRVANRFNFGGTNVTVDAACASSLAAIYQAVMELETGRADMAIAGGIDTQQSPFGYLCFAKTKALSPRGVCNTFDRNADGIVISEGLAAVALKRLADAEADGDRIYAVIKGIGASSDGRAKGLTAPLPAGQKRALWRAYAQAGYAPSTVEVFEAHGTGTVAGDRAELETVSGVLTEAGAAPRSVAIGSVKALIGHTKAAAGVAGLIKIALGLYHRVLPPHALVKEPNAAFAADDLPIYLTQQPRPWVAAAGRPRRAGVSSFGFGGTNFHMALEEYDDPVAPPPQAELGLDIMPIALSASTRQALAKRIDMLVEAIHSGTIDGTLRTLARHALAGNKPSDVHRLGFVAHSFAEANEMLSAAMRHLQGDGDLPPGLRITDKPTLMQEGARLAYVFPGQGSQYPDMQRQSALLDRRMLDRLDRAEEVLAETQTFRAAGRKLAQFIYPGCAFDPAAKRAQMAALTATEVAQPALGAVEAGLLALLGGIGLKPDMVAGHSYGEFVALHAAGVLGFDDLIALSEARGRAMVVNGDPARPGAMAAVAADRPATEVAINGLEDIVIANVNGPSQTVIAGPEAAVASAIEVIEGRGIGITRVPVSQAFHSPLMAAARADFDRALGAVGWRAPELPVYSNTLGARHASDTSRIRDTMSAHLVSTVEFVDMVRAMAADGARVFVEVGPKSVLSGRIREILSDQEVEVIPLDRSGADAEGLMDGLVQLFVHGAEPDLGDIVGRMAVPAPRTLPHAPKALWYLNGGYVRRADAPRRDVRAAASGPRPATAVAQAPEAADAGVPALRAATPSRPGRRRNGNSESSNDEGFEFMDMTPDNMHLGTDRTDVLASFHSMMSDFLRVQQEVMLAYLGQEPEPAGSFLQLGAVTHTPAPAAPDHTAPPRADAGPHLNGSANGHDAAPAAPAAAPVQAAAPAAPEPPPPAVAEAPPPAKPDALSGDALLATFISLIADKTGYPEDALDPDQNLEADLGVDSIKRMEILGSLQKMLTGPAADAMRAEMDSIAELHTIREITAFLGSRIGAEGAAPNGGGARPFDLTGEADDRAAAVLPRFVQRAFAEPADHVAADLRAGTVVVVTETADGFHEDVLTALAEAGAEGRVPPRAALETEDGIEAWLAELRRGAAPGGLIFLGSRASVDLEALDIAEWRATHRAISKGFFRLVRAMAPDLRQGGRIVAATEMGGHFGRVATAGDGAEALRDGAAGGGTVGLVKALSLEWPECSSKAVDLDASESRPERAAHLVREMSFLRGRREAGYPGGVRTIFRTEPQSMEPPLSPQRAIGPDWVVLATGGARGITAECLRTLAPYGPRLILVGRSAAPAPEPPELSGLDVAGLRTRFLEDARAAGQPATPREIERRVQRHLAERDMRQNLADLQGLGAAVEYRVLDVSDAAAVAAFVDALYGEFGRIDMLVHGAGLIEDAFIEKKSAESFDRVFDTKVDAAFLLARALRPESLQALCFFTSVAGRYGNRGQTDYATANETLNRLAWDLARRWPHVTVKAINWGPWGQTTTGAGMVTEEVRAQFLSRGIGMVEAAPGRDFFFKEMFWAPRDEVESVGWVADGETLEELICGLPDRPGQERIGAPPALLLARGIRRENGKREVIWRFDPVNAPYVDHHRFDRIGVMPFAAMMQMLAEIPAIFGDERPVTAVERLSVLNGVTLRNGPTDLHFEMAPRADDGGLPITVRCADRPNRIAYRGVVFLADALPPPPAEPQMRPIAVDPEGPEIAEIYARILSHGPRFQTLLRVDSCTPGGLQGVIRATRPQDFVPVAADLRWHFDPGLVDGLLQTIWIWTRHVQNMSTLPLSVDVARRYSAGPVEGPMIVNSTMRSAPDDLDTLSDLRAFDQRGALVIELLGVRGRASAALNRLSGGWQGGVREAPAVTEAAE